MHKNRFPKFLYPIYKNGMFNIGMMSPNENLDSLLMIMDIPVIPPSKILFGTKKLSSENAATAAPMVMAK